MRSGEWSLYNGINVLIKSWRDMRSLSEHACPKERSPEDITRKRALTKEPTMLALWSQTRSLQNCEKWILAANHPASGASSQQPKLTDSATINQSYLRPLEMKKSLHQSRIIRLHPTLPDQQIQPLFSSLTFWVSKEPVLTQLGILLITRLPVPEPQHKQVKNPPSSCKWWGSSRFTLEQRCLQVNAPLSSSCSAPPSFTAKYREGRLRVPLESRATSSSV